MLDQQVDKLEEKAIATESRVSPENDAWRVLPITISQVLQAEPETLSFSKCFVTFVAHVTSVEMCPAKAIYFLEDGTGRIRAEKGLISLVHHDGLSVVSEAEKKETAQTLALEHTYVQVIGTTWGPRIKIQSISPVGYNEAMYHILNVIQSNRLIQEYSQKHDHAGAGMDSHGDMEIDRPVDSGQTHQDDIPVKAQCHVPDTIPVSHPILSSSFVPQRQYPYATLQPIERAIMMHMHHHNKHCQILTTKLRQEIQVLHRCTEAQFDHAIQALLSEAFITSPLDDGYVVLTPRY